MQTTQQTTDQKLLSHTPTYIIVMRDVLIAQDLSLTIGDHDPGARIEVASSLTEAEAIVARLTQIVMAFIVEAPRKFRHSDLSRAIAERGGRVVLLGDDAEDGGPTPDWDVLYRPFSTDEVLARLTRWDRPQLGAA